MQKILILGGSGILSSDVCRVALSKGYDVTCLTRGTRDFALPQGVKSIHGDANKLFEIEDKLDHSYSAVYDFLTLNVDQLKSKLEVLGSRCKQYFFVSSATVYEISDDKVKEDSPLGNQFWDYGKDKIKCEEFLREFKKDGFNYTIIRPYVTYGNTRIPFGVISNGRYWSLANRIINKKPILLWDNGQAICTLTHTTDFAKGFVGLTGNIKAFNEAFHITSDETLSWKEVLEYVCRALGCEADIVSASTDDIIKELPEFKGVLLGDKARNRIFDNTKIKETVGEFRDFVPFETGIKWTIDYYRAHDIERKIDYMWDGKVDRAIIHLSKKLKISIDKSKIHFLNDEGKASFKDRIQYMIGRYKLLGLLYDFLKKVKK